VKPEFDDNMQEHECRGGMEAQGVTIHDDMKVTCNSHQNRMRSDQRCCGQTRQVGCCKGHTCGGVIKFL
jgi:hypothetical protein